MGDTVVMTLTDFLLARIAEDEAAAGRASDHNFEAPLVNDDYGHLLTQSSRVLAECEAKRNLVAFASEQLIRDGVDSEPWAGEEVLTRLATVYADHPDYRAEWRH